MVATVEFSLSSSMRITSRIILEISSRPSESITSKRVREEHQPPDQPPPKKQSRSSCTIENTNICAICLGQVSDECSIDETVERCNHDECQSVFDASSACNHRFCRECVTSMKEFNREFRPLRCPVCRRPKGCRTPTRGPLPSNPVELQNMDRALRLEVSQALNRIYRVIIETAREHMDRFVGQPSDSEDDQELTRYVESFTSRYTAAGSNYVECIQALQDLLLIFENKDYYFHSYESMIIEIII